MQIGLDALRLHDISGTGTLTVTRKAHISGLIFGAMGAAGALGSGQKAEHQLLQRQLACDLEQAGPSLDEPAFSNRQAFTLCIQAVLSLLYSSCWPYWLLTIQNNGVANVHCSTQAACTITEAWGRFGCYAQVLQGCGCADRNSTWSIIRAATAAPGVMPLLH